MNANQATPRHRFCPQVENLEDRTVPAGNVLVMVGDGILYVSGDDQGNQLSIQGAGKNAVVVRSLDGTTTLNGQSNALFVKGIKRGYHIDMFSGNDVLFMSGTRAKGTLVVNMGDGDDTFILDNAGHRKETTIRAGSGNDTVLLNGSAFRRYVFIDTGTGDDQVIASQIGIIDFGLLNPGGNDFFDNRGSTIVRASTLGFTPGTRPVDTTPPTATLTTTASNPTAVAPLAFTASFSEDVFGFDQADIISTNGTVTSFTQLDARTYTFLLNPTAQGSVSAMIVASGAFDVAGNANLASETITRTFDTLAPNATIASQTTNSRTPVITGTVDDPTASITLQVAGQTLPATVAGNTWSAAVMNPLNDGTYSVTATATDAVGNTASTTNATALVVDATAPTISFTTSPGLTTNASTIQVSILFNEDVTDFTEADIINSNSTKANFQALSARLYTIDIMPEQEGNVGILIAQGAAIDAAGNPSQAANLIIQYDPTPPSGAINDLGQSTISGTSTDTLSGVQMVEVSIKNTDGLYFSGADTGFDSTTALFFQTTSTNNFATWSFPISFGGTFTVHTRITDRAGNQGEITHTVIVDNTPPEVVIDATQATPNTLTGTSSDAATSVTVVQATVFDASVVKYLSTSGLFDSDVPVFILTTTSDNFANWSLQVPTSGTYDVVARAVDAVGNTGSDAKTVTIP